MIIDANNLILGRMGAYVAKQALLGEKIDIINCEKSVISGKRHQVLAHYRKLFARGIHTKGPFYYRRPDMFVKRSIRGMLPYKRERGLKAFKNIKCYIGAPASLSGKAITIKEANADKLQDVKFISVKELCMHVGAKIK